MSSHNRKPFPIRTTRRPLKVAFLGLAGLLAGLLSGCSSSTAARFSAWCSGSSTTTASRRMENIDYRSSPAIRHAPVPRYHQATSDLRLHLSHIDGMGHRYDARSARP
ncbi:MAG: hypothetical protein PW789_12930 [Edaphobacter sp.]|uniref:hypothetical protein n=1 Tax=Edaphobacter sp. TaxID=1934404 RepID=UPI00238EDFAF|nr:hypothetical protein [Edaphobacter sp.]MDE1177488.1 hypothetical protein [Edaphobacter sp.]